MPLFQASGKYSGAKPQPRRRRMRNMKSMGSCRETDDDGAVISLTRLCLLSIADNMKEVWAKDYTDNYLDKYFFRHIMGPFNLLPSELVEELTWLLCNRKQLSRAALHLLLVPQLRGLCLEMCPGLVTSALCAHIASRCQGLWSLDLSGAQQLPSKVLSETLHCIPTLRSLSLAGVPCDRCVIRTIAHRCRFLRHLDVSRCHFLSPAALLPLGGGALCSSSGSPSKSTLHYNSTTQSSVSTSFSTPLSPLPLNSLLALDIGFGEQEGDPVAAAAYLLLSLPCLETVAMEGLAQACCLIEHREFSQTNEFTEREGFPRLEDVWKDRRHRQDMDGWRQKKEAVGSRENEDEDEKERTYWEEYGSTNEEDVSRDEGPVSIQNQADVKKSGLLSQAGDDHLILCLKDIKGLTFDSLDSLGHLCPDIHSVSVSTDHVETRGRCQVPMLVAGLKIWSGQLQRLSIYFPGPVLSLLPALQVAGSSLVSLTLEGVKTSPHTSLLEVIKACSRLRDLFISAEPPTTPQEEEDEENQQDYRDLPRLPNLCSLILNFSYEHGQMKPIMSWMSLKRLLKHLLTGSPLLEKLSLVSLPCPLNCVLQEVLHVVDLELPGPADSPLMPLGRVRHIDLSRTDVRMRTVKSIMQRSKRLKFVDVSYCWQITQFEWLDCKAFSKVQVVWE